MHNSNDIRTFSGFWRAYLREHRSATSRAWHYAGVLTGAALAIFLVLCGAFFFLPLAILPGIAGAAIGHRLSPRHTHVIEEAPVWAALADVKMLGLFLTGRLDRELERVDERAPLFSSPHTA